MRLGRPMGSQNKEVKLSGKEEDIKKLLDKKVAVAAIARILDVNRLTVRSFIKTRKLESWIAWESFKCEIIQAENFYESRGETRAFL